MKKLKALAEKEIKENIHEKIICLKKDIEGQFIKLGAYLKLVRDGKLYVEKGCESFESYIAQPELSLKRSTVYSLIGVFEDYYEKSNQTDLVEIGYSKLDRIRQFKEEENFEEWIEKARTLSLSDLNKEIKEARGEVVDDGKRSELPPESEQYKEVVCPACGAKFNVRI